MPESGDLLNLIFEAIDDLNGLRGPDEQIDKTAETTLFGDGSRLDSLGLVGLIVSTEQKIDEKFGVAVTLADEKAMSMKNSPFRTVQTLADYAGTLIEDARRG